MDKLAFEFFNIILPASRAEEAANNIKDLIAAGDIENEVEDNVLKAELYIANISQRDIPLSTKILCNISKLIYSRMYSWAGDLKVESRAALEAMINRISAQWEYSLIDEDLRLELLASTYHCILKHKPFFDGNEKVARLFVNYLALKYNLPLFTIKPSLNELKLADEGDIIPLKERIRSVLYLSADGIDPIKLGPSASVTD